VTGFSEDVGVGVGVGVVFGVAFVDVETRGGVGVGPTGDAVGVGAVWLMFGVARALGELRRGTKSTVPKLKLFLESWIVWFIVWVSVVPHQL